jgi:hypothetical protein
MNGDEKRPNRGRLLDAAFRTADDHIDHRKYGSEAAALKSPRRRCRGFTPTQYRNALREATDLLGSVEEAIAPFDRPGRNGTARSTVRRRRCPGRVEGREHSRPEDREANKPIGNPTTTHVDLSPAVRGDPVEEGRKRRGIGTTQDQELRPAFHLLPPVDPAPGTAVDGHVPQGGIELAE